MPGAIPSSTHPNDSNPYLSDPDVLLMLDFQKGNRASFENLMHKHYKRILNFIYRFTGIRETAEDLTQEVFIKVYNSGPTYRPKAKFQTWIFTIAKNISLNELRRFKNKPVSLDGTWETEDGEMAPQVEDTRAPSPDQEIIQDEKAVIVKAAIDALPENQRMAVILRRYEDLSYEEIAKTMGCSVKAVKSLLNRAKENLRNKLAGFIS